MRPDHQKEKHRKIIGSILVVFGTMMLLSSLFAYNILEFIFTLEFVDRLDVWDFGLITIVEPFRFFYIVPILTSLWGALQLATGIGLLNRQDWAEKLSFVLAFFMLFNMPFGTALAIYIFYAFLDGHKKTASRHGSSAVSQNR